MILPVGATSFREAVRMGSEVFHSLKKIISKKYGSGSTSVGDEGGFAPLGINTNNEVLGLLREAVKSCGYEGKFGFGLDVAASEFFCNETKTYDLDFKNPESKSKISGAELVKVYEKLVEEFPEIVSIEDPFDQDDFENWTALTASVGKNVQVVGDDLLVTNPSRIKMAIEKKCCNALLLKVNQIGSLTESIKACQDSQAQGWGVMVSHRSGETEDTFIADLAVGLRSGQIKTGAPSRSERTAKYNQLMRIEDILGDKCVFPGKHFKKLSEMN
jgi:enolase